MAGEYEGVRRVVYDCGDSIGDAQFVPVCRTCGLFVKADPSVTANELRGLVPGPNATCRRCGRTEMLFEGFF